ncbi:MAG TPA: hypothetical protein VGC55_09665 [Dokdonella sp.]
MPTNAFAVSALMRGCLLAAAGCLAWSASSRAERVEPPLELLYAPGNMLVAGPILEINPSGRIVFQRKDVLGGKERPPEQIDVRVPMSSLRTVQVGERYIFGYTNLRTDPRNPTRAMLDPNGAVVLTSIGLDPALFRDTPEARAILKAARSERGRESRSLFDQLLKALNGADPALQTLAAGEFAQEPEFGERLREDGGQAVIEKAIRNAALAPGVRTTLLVAAATRPRDFGERWPDAAIDIVTNTPVGGYSTATADPYDLVLTALALLDKQATKLSPDALQRWVWSPSPPLVERASVMLRRQSPALERSTIQQALADPKLPANTRTFLNDHLRRLDRLDARSKARKDGTG